jgi:DNA-binding protein YbaB
MENHSRTGPGLLADIERLEQEARQAQSAVAETTGTAKAADELVEATVTGRGELAELVLDARVYRDFAPDELAGEIVQAVNEAHTAALRNAMAVLAAEWPTALPTGLAGIDGDPAFGPLLAQLEQLRSAPRRTP